MLSTYTYIYINRIKVFRAGLMAIRVTAQSQATLFCQHGSKNKQAIKMYMQENIAKYKLS
jgi:hypothetical protein